MKIEIFDFIIELKEKVLKKEGKIKYFYENKDCINTWANLVGEEKYLDILSLLKIKQLGNLVVIKYLDWDVVFTKNKTISFADYWNIYNGIYRECRGIVIDVVREKIVCLPLPKFFNINEQEETSEYNIQKLLQNAKDVEFADKLDGSLIITGYYEKELIVASSSMLDAKLSPMLLMAREICKEDNYLTFIREYSSSNYTPMFEFIFDSEDNHIVDYDKSKYGLYLIGIRNNNTGEIESYSNIAKIARFYDIPCAERYSKTFDEILECKKNYKATEKEGFVMYVDGKLFKIKCDNYILCNKLLSSFFNENNIIKALYLNKIDDFSSKTPEEIKPFLNNTLEKIREYSFLMEEKIDYYYNKGKDYERVYFFKWVNENVPLLFRKFVSKKYLGKEYSVLLKTENTESLCYVKYLEMMKIIDEIKS